MPIITVIFVVITLFVTVILPLIIWLVWALKVKGISMPIIVGMLGFYLPQVIIRIPALQLLSTQGWFITFAENNPTVYALTLGTTAALFETAGRVLVFLLLKKRLSYNIALGAGYGHGAFEAIYITGLAYINNLIIVVMYNIGGVGALTTLLGDEQTAESIITTFAVTEPYLFLIAGLERVMVVPIHMALSTIICIGFYKGRLITAVVVAVLAHTLLDTVSVILSQNGVSVIFIELFVLLFTVAAVAVLIKSRQYFDKEADLPTDMVQDG